MQNPIRTAAAANGGLVTGTLLEAVVKRFGYVLNVGEILGDLDFDVGEPPLVVISAVTGFVYFYDATDATTIDDGVTCLVSGNGLRYKASSGTRPLAKSVLGFASSPPGSPIVGDLYIVATAATGGFAGRDDAIALFTRRGWVYATPTIGLTILNRADGTNWQFTNSGWSGFAAALTDGSVRPEALLKAAGIAVESTLNTPPGSPAANTYWLVGTVPTGAFVGHVGDIAYYRSSAWRFLAAYEGATVFHKGFGFLLHYVSGAWLGGSGSDVQEFSTAGSFTWTKPSKGNMALIQVWAAGGSGGRGSSAGFDAGGGGAGGACVERVVRLSDLGATESVTVGAGGAARTTNNTNGQTGGNSSVGTVVVAYGGAGGNGTTSQAGGGGGGGGQGAAGSVGGVPAGGNGGTSGSGLSAGAGGAASGNAGGSGAPYGGGGGGAGGNNAFGGAGGASEYGGGGGGGGHASSGLVGGAGGRSTYGGGGGGGGSSGGGAAGAGGASLYGGNGGAGATGTASGTAGAQPGGGGGGTEGGNSGKGGDGRVRVTVW